MISSRTSRPGLAQYWSTGYLWRVRESGRDWPIVCSERLQQTWDLSPLLQTSQYSFSREPGHQETPGNTASTPRPTGRRSYETRTIFSSTTGTTGHLCKDQILYCKLFYVYDLLKYINLKILRSFTLIRQDQWIVWDLAVINIGNGSLKWLIGVISNADKIISDITDISQIFYWTRCGKYIRENIFFQMGGLSDH